MYCKKCGKFIGNDSDFCDECLAKEQAAFSEFSEAKPQTPAPACSQENAYNASDEIRLGKPIAAIILSSVGFLLMYFWLIIASVIVAAYGSDSGVLTMFTLMSCAPTVLGLIFGIQSIQHFKATSKIRSGKRIPVLILGISSVITAGFGLFFAFIVLMICGMI